MAEEKVSYKETIQLPKTSFPMKANLSQREPELIKNWQQNSIYSKMVAKNEGKGRYTMPDGPPYANGGIHIGHVLNKVLKDIVIKYQNLKGNSASFIPGWDCHGLPIEQNVTKKLGPKRKEKTDSEIRSMCRLEAKKWVDKQEEEFIRLGILADWESPYYTMQKEYEAQEVRELAKVLKNGVLYRGEKPVYWCAALQTALAEAEIEYHTHKSPSIYVKFYVEENLEKLGSPTKPISFVIWTTTPWTLPANLAISLHPKFEYGFYDVGEEIIIIAKGMKEAFEADTGLTLTETHVETGAQLEGIQARHPFMNRNSVIVLGEHVSLEAGSGCVHTAPGHGQDDYQVGLKYNLELLSPVDAYGNYTDQVPEYEGKNIFECNPLIVEKLRESGHLVSVKEIEHQYPYCWRSKTPLIFRATPQWFIGMDEGELGVRKKALEALDHVQFVPAWGEKRIRAMIENRPDWCLSRQRIWGVPIPILHCKDCGEHMADYDVMMRVADAMEEEDGIEAYHRHPVEKFAHDKNCGQCGSSNFSKGQDILDVWFDSGVCFSAVQEKRNQLDFPADIYLEGSDQHRGWFQTSLLASIASTGKSPFKMLLTHNFVNDAKGRKMSKSLGNVVKPQDIIKKSGAELLRLWVSSEDYGQDLSFGNESFQRITETYRRIRNTMRFLLGNCGDFNPETDQVNYDQLMPLDQWALHQLNHLVEEVTEHYDNYDYYKVYHALNQYFTVTLSNIYLDILKDRLYTWKKEGNERRGAQTVLNLITQKLLGLMAPILSFLAEEAYQHLPGKTEESIFLVDFPKAEPSWNNGKLSEEFEKVLAVRSEVSKVLEDLRTQKVIGSSLEGHVKIVAKEETLDILKKYEKSLSEYFIVSKVSLEEGDFSVHAEKASGEKCVRCWNYSEDTGKDERFPDICPKCVRALS